jgi:hypothetical protein
MPEIKEIFTGVLSETLNLDENGVASLFNEDGSMKDDAKQTVLDLFAKRVSDLKSGSQKTAFDDGYKKAQSEVLSKFESDFKAKTGHKSDKKGIDLVLDYANTAKKEGELTDDELKKHPKVLTWLEEKDQAIEAAKADGETKLSQFQKELNKKETFGKVSTSVLEYFHKMNPVLSSDPVKRKAQEELFVERFQGYDFEIQGERILVLKDGKAIEDTYGKVVTLEKMVKDTAGKYYDFHAADPKKNAGNGDDPKKKVTPVNITVPKNDEEYTAALFDKTKTIEEKNMIKEAYAKAKEASNN